MKTEKQNELFDEAIKQLEIGLPRWTEYCKTKTIEYLDDKLRYQKENKKIVIKSVKNLRKLQKSKNRFIRKTITFNLKKLSLRTSILIKENKKENLKFPENIGLILKATDSLIKYALKNEQGQLKKSMEFSAKAISGDEKSNKTD